MACGSYYLFWLVAPLVLSVVTRHPLLAAVAVVGFLARRWLPDPFLYFKYSGRIATLSHEIAANPHNAAAQRELALIYLEKGRPARAIALLEAALQRDPDSADLLYHYGRALLGGCRCQEAADRLAAAVACDPRIAYGDAHLRAGDALLQLRRFEEAEAAFQCAIRVNASGVEAMYKLGAARASRGDRDQARAAFQEARTTYRQLPGFQKRKTWLWALRAWWATP
jgi:tetratricopeptide (TPR) repeat protein